MSDKIEWCWLAPDGILHAYHPTRNSVTACEQDWDGWTHVKNADPRSYPLCAACQDVFKPKPAAPADEGEEAGPCVNFSTSPPCGAIAPCDSTTSIEDRCDNYIRADAPTAPADEGDIEGMCLHQPCPDHRYGGCYTCPGVLDGEIHYPELPDGTSPGDIIATLQAALDDARTDSRQQKDRVKRLVDGSKEKDKRIEELEEQRSVSLKQINTLGAKLKSAEEELAKVKGKDGLNVNN